MLGVYEPNDDTISPFRFQQGKGQTYSSADLVYSIQFKLKIVLF